jgi:perosamine synthetase
MDIPLFRPYFDKDELKEIKKVLESGWVSQGPKVKEFEEAVSNYVGAKNAIAVTNCTAALHLALLGIGVTSGDEVLVSDYTFPATGHAVLYCGARPVFVDVNLETYNIDVSRIEEKITSKTRAVIPVHTFGQPAEMDEIVRVAREHDLRVIEDAACGVGAEYKGVQAGIIGDAGCYSFHARKGVTTGEGGMVVTGKKRLAEKIRYLSVFGMKTAWEREQSEEFVVPEFQDLGFNYKMSDISAAVGVAQMRKIDKVIARKSKLAKCWDEKLDEIDLIQKPFVSRKVKHVYQSYVCLVDRRIKRNRLIVNLKKKGIQTQIGTYASHVQPVYKSRDRCPNSLDIFNRSLALPIYYRLKEEEIDTISKILRKTLGELK